MGKLDDMAKELYEDDRVFADTINVLFFDGEQRIHAQDLSPLDTTEEHTIFDDEFISVTEINVNADKSQSKAEAYSNQKYRDAVRLRCLGCTGNASRDAESGRRSTHNEEICSELSYGITAAK